MAGDQTDTLQDTLTVGDKRKVVTDDLKVSRIGDWIFAGAFRNFFFIPDRRPGPSLTVWPLQRECHVGKEQKKEISPARLSQAWELQDLQGLVILMASLRNGREKRIQMNSSSLRVAQSSGPNSPSHSSSKTSTGLHLRRSWPQLPMFIPPLRVSLCVHGAFPSCCCRFKTYHLSAGPSAVVFPINWSQPVTDLCFFSTPPALLD